MALKDLVSDLSNFKTKGDVAYDKLDPQINNGVDYFPDDTSGAKGFTTKTNLETKYNKFMKDVRQNKSLPNQYEKQANISAPNSGVRINSISRNAYGIAGEYLEGEGVGMSMINHVLSSDNVLGVRLQPKFTTDFMTTPLTDFNTTAKEWKSEYSPPNILSQTFTLASPELQKPDFSSWTAYSAIGDTVTQFASLIPLANRTSNFSTSEIKGNVGAYITPKGYTISPQTTLNLPKENWRYSTEATNDVFKASFSTFDYESFGLGSSQFTNKINLFHRYENSDFTNVSTGIGSDNFFPNLSFGDGGSFREAADPLNLTHPIVLRPFGSNWKNAHEDLQYAFGYTGLKSVKLNFGNTLGIGGASLLTEASRNIADYYRLDQWFSTPQGISFIEKQHSLQKMNPTIETKFYNEDSKFGVTGGFPAAHEKTVLPIFHPQRHAGGVLARYEHVLGLTGLNPEPGIQLTGGSRLAYQAEAFTVPVPVQTIKTENPNFFTNTANLAINSYNKLSDFLGVDLIKAPIMIGLSNPNKYSPFTSAAPISTHLGIVAFGTPTAFVAVDTLIALNKEGGTFNKRSAEKPEPGLKRYSTNPYGLLTKNNSYGPKNIKNVVKNIGSPGDLGIDASDKAPLGLIKGNMKSANVDKVNAHPYGESDLSETLRDFIKFRFKDVVNNQFIIFRAILDGISDSITPEYGEERYIGRPDKVYVYQGADRNISFNFSVYPKTKQEFPILMEKLNHLIGLCYPSYTENELMITPFIELTLGDMFVDASGLLTSLAITVEDNSTWELDDGLQFPHYIKAACEFKYIGNNRLSSTSSKHYNLDAGILAAVT